MCAVLAFPCAAAERPPALEIQPGMAKPGDAVLIVVRAAHSPLSASIGDRSLLFFPNPGGFISVTAIPVEQAPGELEVKVRLPELKGQPLELAGTVEVIEPEFPRRELEVANRYIHPPPQVRRWIAQDRVALQHAYDQPPRPPLFRRNFAWPRLAVVTSHFGDLRLFNGAKQSQHYGTDLNGRVGDPVTAANDGVVVLARSCYSSGNTLVLHHGAQLFTAYFHLAKMQVAPGATVKRGQQIGQVGKSGRVTGPHLHWAAKVKDLYVNAESLLRLGFE
ncbi:MAG TPA: M23 family metallopeptidase [Myxococcaceae bacterium]|nr:M23 family metallopeptidase [Myxococcaceae bacterium]